MLAKTLSLPLCCFTDGKGAISAAPAFSGLLWSAPGLKRILSGESYSTSQGFPIRICENE